MNPFQWPSLLMAASLLVAGNDLTAAAVPTPLLLWPNGAPGEKGNVAAEADLTKPGDELIAGQRLIRLGNVTQPTVTLFRPPATNDSGTTVVVLPGGGYHILAMDLEGTEICTWLNSIGVTAALVKYRVPKRPGLERHAAPLQDAQRALGMVRYRAADWGIDPRRIGVMGFSAGAHLSAVLSTQPDTRTYPGVDDADRTSCRPDFTMLIYPAYLTQKELGDRVSPEIPLSSNAPPTFMVITQDDVVRVENALHYSLALQRLQVPFGLHVYPTGGHGYGLRRTAEPVTTWTDRATDWLRHRRLLTRPGGG